MIGTMPRDKQINRSMEEESKISDVIKVMKDRKEWNKPIGSIVNARLAKICNGDHPRDGPKTSWMIELARL